MMTEIKDFEMLDSELEMVSGGFRAPKWLRRAISFVPVVGAVYTTVEDVSEIKGGGNKAARILLGVLRTGVDVATTVSGTGLAGLGMKTLAGTAVKDLGAKVVIGGCATVMGAGYDEAAKHI